MPLFDHILNECGTGFVITHRNQTQSEFPGWPAPNLARSSPTMIWSLTSDCWLLAVGICRIIYHRQVLRWPTPLDISVAVIFRAIHGYNVAASDHGHPLRSRNQNAARHAWEFD